MPSGPSRRPPHELAFAAAIRAARVEAGRTQADVAEKAGLAVRVVQRAQGQRRINLGEAAAIAEALGRSLDELVKVSETATFEPPTRAGLGNRLMETASEYPFRVAYSAGSRQIQRGGVTSHKKPLTVSH